MTKDEFTKLAKILRTVYTADKFLQTKEALEIWYRLLQDIPYQPALAAVELYITSNKFPPTIADIREKAYEVKEKASGKPSLSEGEAWALVKKALTRSIYYYDEEWEKLPPEIQKAMGSAMNLHDIAASDDVNMQVEESLFSRRYRAEIEKAREEEKMHPKIKELIAQISENVQSSGTMIEEKPQEVEENTN